MKYLKLFSLLLVFGAFMAVSACNNSSGKDSSEKMEEVDKNGPEYTSAYVCPMHCDGSGSAEQGECPVCGMAYVANEDMKGNGDGHDHDDHNH